MKIPNPHIFRAYDIRGVVDEDLTEQVVFALGRAIGTILVGDGGARVGVGRDCRTHSPRVAGWLMDGLAATGLEVLDVGVVPTPLLYFAVHEHSLDGGVMVTGSHNPPEYNGFKIMRGLDSVHGEAIQGLRERMEREEFVAGEGVQRSVDVFPAYRQRVLADRRPGRALKVVVDAGNGTAGPTAAPLYRALGYQVEELYCRMDGSFPHHHPDPSQPENLLALSERLRAVGADVGFAYDGDADRLGVVDERGELVPGDRLLALMARPVLEANPGATVVGEVKCSQVLFDDIAQRGGKPVMGQVGHSLIKAAMKENGAVLAGELSGHFFFADRWYGFDDAVYAGVRVLELLAQTERPLSSLQAELPSSHATPELRVECPDARKFDVVSRVREHYARDHEVVTIDGVRVRFDDGWALVRASNTQPALVLRVEASGAEGLARHRQELETVVERALRDALP